MSAYAFLEKVYGQAPRMEDTPAHSMQGILHTTNYVDFEIYSDIGNLLHSFQGAKVANRCLPGDHVWWDGSMCQLELRDEHPLIVGTVELTNPSRYGFTKRGIPMYLFTPYDSKYPPFIVGCADKDRSHNLIGLVKLDDWSDALPFPRGRLEQRLGKTGDWNAEKEALRWQAMPWKYPKGGYDPLVRNRNEDAHRKSLKGYTFHIDPKGCKDVDDVLTIASLSENEVEVTITISDVACYIEDGSAVDILAGVMSQTLYDSDGVVLRPMLPQEYSEGTCSLLPGKQSYGVSLSFRWNGISITKKEWFLSVFETQQSYTYEEAMVDKRLSILSDIATFMAGGEPQLDSHQWIEQMMLFYNKEAGTWLKKEKNGILRRHSVGDRENLEKYKKNLPEWKHLAMTSAEYCSAEEKDTMHDGIQTDAYAHASSPIRRYADLVNQRILKRLIMKKIDDYIVPVTIVDFNERERAIKRFARDMAFIQAMETGMTHYHAIVLEMKPTNKETEVKITLYVPAWKRKVSVSYKSISSTRILIRDETEEMELTEFQHVMIECSFDINQRNWKDRTLLRIHPLPLPAFE